MLMTALNVLLSELCSNSQHHMCYQIVLGKCYQSRAPAAMFFENIQWRYYFELIQIIAIDACHNSKSLAALVLSVKHLCCQIARRHADDKVLSLFKS